MIPPFRPSYIRIGSRRVGAALIALGIGLLILSAVASAQTYQFCGHGRCTRPHRVYERTCHGVQLLSPRPIRSCNPADLPAF